MKDGALFWWAAGGLLLLTLGAGGLAVVNTMWKQQGAGPTWLPALNQAEGRYGIPADLLARIAYQESHFRPDIISGATVSPAGALGLMQLMPQYFASVQVPRPFTPVNTLAQIDEAARLLQGLFAHFNDWQLAVAGYNDGQGNVDQFLAGARDLPDETYAYLAQVFGDVPVQSNA
jgi:soluble lytic murein transglycosylase-like protein